MLDTHFPRFAGDIGHADSFQRPPIYFRVEQASVEKVVRGDRIDANTTARFIAGAQDLERAGATVIGTSCGFTAPLQHKIQAALGVPFISSSLLLIPLLRGIYSGDAVISVLTFSDNTLGGQHFNGALDPNIAIFGLDPNGHWANCISNDLTEADYQLAQAEVLALVDHCINIQPQTRALVLECTNLSPWKKEIKQRCGIPVFDLVDALEWLTLVSAPT